MGFSSIGSLRSGFLGHAAGYARSVLPQTMKDKVKITVLISTAAVGVSYLAYKCICSNNTTPSNNIGGNGSRQIAPLSQIPVGRLTQATIKRLDPSNGVIDIELAPKPMVDRDENYAVTIVTEKGREKASIFAGKLNGEPKSFENLVNELVLKIENHLSNKQRKELILLPSGAMIDPRQTTVSMQVVAGYFCVDGKKVVVKAGQSYIPLPAHRIQTYTLLEASQEGDLFIINDDHPNDNGNEGFIFNLKNPIQLEKTSLSIPADISAAPLPDKGEYLVLHRYRRDA